MGLERVEETNKIQRKRDSASISTPTAIENINFHFFPNVLNQSKQLSADDIFVFVLDDLA